MRRYGMGNRAVASIRARMTTAFGNDYHGRLVTLATKSMS